MRSDSLTMAQITITSRRSHLAGRRERISGTIHDVVVNLLGLPTDKRFHRFIALDEEDFIHPPDRSEAYTMVEISMFAGRSTATKKLLIRELFVRFENELNITPQDLEITISENPRENWGIRGKPGDELDLPYRIET